MNAFDLMATLSLDTSAYDSGLQQALAAAGDFGGELESSVGDAASVAEDSMSDAAEGMADSMSSASDDIASSAETFADAITSGADDSASSMDSLADSMEEGSKSGVESLFELGDELGGLKGIFGEGAGAAESFATKLTSFLKSPIGVATALAAAIAGITKAIIDGAKATAEYGDHIDKMSQKIGISAEAYQKWDYVMQLSDTDIDNMKMGMKTLSTQAEKNAEEFQKLGISQEEVANLSKEDLFEKTIKGLAEMEDGTERSVLASKLLGRAGADMAPLLNQGSEAIEEQMRRAEEYGMVMSEESVKASAAFQDSGTTLKMTIDGMKHDLLDDFLPSMTQVREGLAKVFAGDGSGAVEIAKGIGEFIRQGIELIPTVIGNFAQAIGTAAIAIAKALGTALIEKVPVLFENLMSFLDNAINRLSEWQPSDSGTADAAAAIVKKIAEAIVKNAPKIIIAMAKLSAQILLALGKLSGKLLVLGGTLMLKLLSGLQKASKNVLAFLGSLVAKAVKRLLSKLGEFATAGGKWVTNIIKGITGKVSDLLGKVGGLMRDALSKFRESIGDWVQAGRDIVSGIISGVSQMISQFLGKIGSMASQGVQKFKGIFKIGSPSKVMEDLAKWIPIGAALGIEENQGVFLDSVQGMADAANSIFSDGLDMDANGGILDIGGTLDVSDEGSAMKEIFANAVADALTQLIPYMQESIADAASGMTIEIDKRTLGKVARKAVAGAY